MNAIPVTHPTVNKNTQTDFNEGWAVVREIEAVQARNPSPLWTPPDAECFRASGKNLLLRFFANVSAATPVIQIWSWSAPGGQRADQKGLLQVPAPSPLFHGTLTHSGFTYVGYHPITRAETAGTTWYAVSDFTSATGHCSNLIVENPAIAAAGYEKRFSVDCFGETMWWPFATSMGGVAATKIIVAAKRLE
ncbi:MAG: hypothetical protein V1929_09175 [bacterium]